MMVEIWRALTCSYSGMIACSSTAEKLLRISRIAADFKMKGEF